MFFFKKKKPKIKKLDDCIWLNKAMRYKGLYEASQELNQKNRLVIIVPFFSESIEEVRFIFNRMNLPYVHLDETSATTSLEHHSIYLANAQWLNHTFMRSVENYLDVPISFLFPEHYPIPLPEQAILEQLNTFEWKDANYQFYDSLDSKLMELFASERIKRVLERMGFTKDEQLSHPMISKSILRAQEKLASQMTREVKADSEAEWFSKNMPS